MTLNSSNGCVTDLFSLILRSGIATLVTDWHNFLYSYFRKYILFWYEAWEHHSISIKPFSVEGGKKCEDHTRLRTTCKRGNIVRRRNDRWNDISWTDNWPRGFHLILFHFYYSFENNFAHVVWTCANSRFIMFGQVAATGHLMVLPWIRPFQ